MLTAFQDVELRQQYSDESLRGMLKSKAVVHEELEKQVWSYAPASWTQDGLSEGISSRTLPLRESPATARKTPDEYDVQRFHDK